MKSQKDLIELVIQITGFIFICIAFAMPDKTYFPHLCSAFFVSITFVAFSRCKTVSKIQKISKIISACMLAGSAYCFSKAMLGLAYNYILCDYIFSSLIFGVLFTYITIFIRRILKNTSNE